MPIYEYKCENCQHLFEKLVRNGRDIPDKCPECGGGALRKAFSTFTAASAAPSSSSPCAETGSCPVGGRCDGVDSCPF